MTVAYAKVRPDANQPRKTFSEASLKELADSIREQGIVQPLILELVPNELVVHAPDLTSNGHWFVTDRSGVAREGMTEKEARQFAEGKTKEFYRIVCGERRWRAAGALKLGEVPALVYRGLTAQQRFTFQFIENHQRENLTALEEAASLNLQIEKRKDDNPAFSPEDLAKELGMSRAAIYERLKLTRLHAPVRAALLAGKISTSVAGIVAQIAGSKEQEKLLEIITDETAYYFPYSVRDVQDMVSEDYVKPLSEAPFDTNATIHSPQGEKITIPFFHPAPCKICPQRTGNLLAEFPELKSRPNVCTQPQCFAVKCKAHWLAQAEHLKDKGQTVLTTGEFKKIKADYVAGDKYQYARNKSGTFEQLMGRHKPEPVLVASAAGLAKFYKKEEVTAAVKKNGVTFYVRSRGGSPTETPEQKVKREAKEAEQKRRTESRGALVESLTASLAAGANKIKDAAAWALLAAGVEANSYMKFKNRLLKQAKGNRARVLLSGLTACLRGVVDYDTGDWDQKTLALWKTLGVDLVAEEKQAAPALPLGKAAPKQKVLIEVPATKKRKAHAKA
jgi:ParB/RepB/Spo0J family partition protein